MLDIVELVFIYGVIGAVPALLGWEWWRQARLGRYPWTLIFVTVSCVWLLMVYVWRGALGPDYSNLHAYIAIGNCSGSLLLALFAGVLPSQRDWRRIVAALLLAYLWFVVLSIMYAV